MGRTRFWVFPVFCFATFARLQAQSLTLNWQDNSNNETGFIIERAAGREGFAEVARVRANATTWTDEAIDFDQEYTYRVAAYNATGLSGYTNTARGSVSSPPPPPPPPPEDRPQRTKQPARTRTLLLN